jgi:phthalate 4,5-dioxygenase reductase subunit
VAEPEIAVVIAAKTLLAESIWRFDLIPERLQALAPFTAGAHITVRTPNGSVRSYSLTDPPGRDDRYAITVNRDTTGRRASVDLIDQTKRGDRLAISPPRNTFQLVSSPTYLHRRRNRYHSHTQHGVRGCEDSRRLGAVHLSDEDSG